MAEANYMPERNFPISSSIACRKVSDLIQGREKALDRYGREIASFFLLYQAARMKERNDGILPDISEPKTFLQDCLKQDLLRDIDLIKTVDDLFDKEEWNKIKKDFNKYAQTLSFTTQSVAWRILNHSFYISSSQRLNRLVCEILMGDVPADSDTNVLDIGSGDGTFMTTLLNPIRRRQSAQEGYYHRLHYTGLDKNAIIQKIAKIRAEVLAQDLSERGVPAFESIDFITEDCRELKEEDQKQYDRIFVDLGRDGRRLWDDDVAPVRRRMTEEKVPSCTNFKYLKNLIDLSDFDAKKLCESEWYAALIAMNLLSEKEGNKAVMTMSVSALCGAAPVDKDLRQKFVTFGWVQRVILLPRPMQRFSRGRECLVVFSRNKAESIRMIDARNFTVGSGWGTQTAPDFIEKIVDAVPKEGICCDVARDEISASRDRDSSKESDYSLYPVKYLMRVEGVSLESLATVTRGKDIPRSKLRKPDDTHQAEEEGAQENAGREKTYYLSISDIASGFLEITEDTIPIETDEVKIEKDDFLKAGDLLLGKMLEEDRFGLQPQARVAVIEEDDLKDENGNERRLIAGSNLFVFRRKPPTGLYDKPEDKFLPYFIKAFLESDACRGQLELAAAGSALSSISISSLKGINVPGAMYDGAEKREKDYAREYKKLRNLRGELKTLTETTKKMFDDPEILRRAAPTDREE